MSARRSDRGTAAGGLVLLCLTGTLATSLAATPHPATTAPRVLSPASELGAAAGTARAFTTDYLAWLAGRRSRRRIASASRELRTALAEQAPVPRGRRVPRWRIPELHTQLVPPDGAVATVRVLDSDMRLELTLTLARTRSGWEVVDVHA